jgi:tetratricopeptide (TPR) repeat protein
MPATLSLDRPLAGPTEAISTPPNALRHEWPNSVDLAETATGEAELRPDGVTAVVDQALALAERNPESTTARARLALAQLAAGRTQAAAQTARLVTSMRQAREDPPSLVVAATVLATLGESQAAEAALTLLGGRYFPHLYAQLAVERNEWELALSRLSGVNDSASRALRGWIEIQRHHYREAVQEYRAIISTGVAWPDVYLNLGYAYGVLGSLPKAIKATRTALTLEPASRTAGFNLAAFCVAAGDMQSALDALNRVRKYHPNDLYPYIASAAVRAVFGQLDQAERELRRAQRDRAGWTDSKHRELLRANLVAIRQARGSLSVKDAYTQVRTILQQVDYTNLQIASLLLPWMQSTRQAKSADELLQELGRRYSPSVLGSFRTQARFLHLDFEGAIDEARRWTIHEPFNAAAVTMLSYLLIETKDAFEEAARICRSASQRMPLDSGIRNNCAYALVQLGRLTEAEKVLGPLGTSNLPLCVATAGLISIHQGRVDDGLSMYERAVGIATQQGDEVVADLIRYRGGIEATRSGKKVDIDLRAMAVKHGSDPRFLISLRRHSPYVP